MGRKPVWPPRITTCRTTNRDRVRFKNRTYHLGRAGSPESRTAYVELVRRLEAEERSSGERTAYPDGHDGTVAGLAALWYLETLKRYGPASHEVTEHALAMRPVLKLYGGTPVKDFDALRLEEVRDSMVGAGLCLNVVNRRVVRIRTAWRWAERRKIAPPGSWSALRVMEALSPARHDVRKTPRPGPVRRDAFAAVLMASGTSGELARLLQLLWLTGARPSELFGLTAGMLDTSGPVWTAKLVHHKCAWRGHERTLHFGPEAQAVLRPLLDRHPDCPLLVNARGGRWDRRTAYQALRRACLAAGVVPFGLYALRHSWRVRVGRVLSIEHARCGMGHASVDTTLLYGGGPDAQLAVEAALRAG